jgi:hypothetical protein
MINLLLLYIYYIFIIGLPFSMTREKLLEYLDEEKCGK